MVLTGKKNKEQEKVKSITDTAITALVAGDETIGRDDAKVALAILRGQKPPELAQEDKILTRREVASKLRVSCVTVTNWARQGVIRRVAIPNRRKAVGYSWLSVMAIMNGEKGDCASASVGSEAKDERRAN